MELHEVFDDFGGVASTSQISEIFDVSPAVVRSWASENGVPLIGNGYAFTVEAAEGLAEEVLDGAGGDADCDDDDADCDDDESDDEDDDSE